MWPAGPRLMSSAPQSSDHSSARAERHPRIVGAGDDDGRHAERALGDRRAQAEPLGVGGRDQHQAVDALAVIEGGLHGGEAAEAVRHDVDAARRAAQLAAQLRRPLSAGRDRSSRSA